MKNFGMVKEITEKVGLINKVLASGNKADKLEDELDVMLEKTGCFSPRKQAKLVALYKKDKTSEAFKTLDAERETAKDTYIATLGSDVRKALIELIGENKKLSRVKTQKRDYKGNWIDFELPMGLDAFKNPLNEKYGCTSVCAVAIKKETLDLTDEEVMRIGFLSVCRDVYDNKYVLHNWKVTYKIEDSDVTIEEKVEADNKIEETFDLL